MSPTLFLAVTPVTLIVSSLVALWLRSLRRWYAQWVAIAGMGVGAVVAIGGLTESIAGNTTQLVWTDPVAGFASGLTATSSGYLTLVISLVSAALMVTLGGRNVACYVAFGVVGVCIACLGTGQLAQACGWEVIWVALFLETRDSDEVSAERWLGLLVLQAGCACMLGATVWQESQSATTALSAIPTTSSSSAAVTWCWAIALISIGAGIGRGERQNSGLGWIATILAPAIFIGVLRFHQVVDPSIPVIASILFMSAAGVMTILGVWRTLFDANRDSVLRWLWVCLAAQFLLACSVTVAGANDAIAPQGLSLLVGGVLLAVAARCGGLVRGVCVILATGFPLGLMLTSAVAAGSTLIAQPSSAVVGIAVLIVAGVTFLAGIRAAADYQVHRATMRNNLVGAFVAVLVVIGGIVPGVLVSTLWAWLADGSATSQSVFSVALPGKVDWPAALVAGGVTAALAGFAALAVLLGKEPSLQVGPVANEHSPLTRWSRVIERSRPLVAKGQAIEDWLVAEPRFGSVVALAFAAVVFLH